jgi:hypothetical protein
MSTRLANIIVLANKASTECNLHLSISHSLQLIQSMHDLPICLQLHCIALYTNDYVQDDGRNHHAHGGSR